jgi:hypothetical protein
MLIELTSQHISQQAVRRIKVFSPALHRNIAPRVLGLPPSHRVSKDVSLSVLTGEEKAA